MLIPNSVLNNQSWGHKFGNHNICFPVVLANSYLGHSVALRPVQRLFCPLTLFHRHHLKQSISILAAWNKGQVQHKSSSSSKKEKNIFCGQGGTESFWEFYYQTYAYIRDFISECEIWVILILFILQLFIDHQLPTCPLIGTLLKGISKNLWSFSNVIG